jgi:hypothetical protein
MPLWRAKHQKSYFWCFVNPNMLYWGMADSKPLLEWQATEYFVRKKGVRWFVIFGVGVVLLEALAIWQHAWTFVVLIVVAVAALIVYTRSTPEKIKYAVLENGVQVGDKTYLYDDLRAFGVIEDENRYYLRIVPKKRFAAAILMHFEKKDGEKIVDTLGAKLQMEKMQLDPLDRILRKLKI